MFVSLMHKRLRDQFYPISLSPMHFNIIITIPCGLLGLVTMDPNTVFKKVLALYQVRSTMLCILTGRGLTSFNRKLQVSIILSLYIKCIFKVRKHITPFINMLVSHPEETACTDAALCFKFSRL